MLLLNHDALAGRFGQLGQCAHSTKSCSSAGHKVTGLARHTRSTKHALTMGNKLTLHAVII